MTTNTRFGRQYEIVIGRVPFDEFADWNDNYVTEDQLELLRGRSRDGAEGTNGILSRIQTTGFTVTENQIKAEVNHSSSTAQSTASLNIYNLDDDVIRFMNSTDYLTFINIKAGYATDNQLSTIFLGEVIKVETKYEKGTKQLVTSFSLKDSLTTIRKTDIFKEFKDRTFGVKARTVLNHLIDCFAAVNIPLGFMSVGDLNDPNGFPEGEEFIAKSYLVSGNLKEEMDRLMQNYLFNFSWTIFAGQLYIWRSRLYFPQDVAFDVGLDIAVNKFIINNNQIIGKPNVTTYNKATNTIPPDLSGTIQDKPTTGLTIQVLLDGRIVPSSIVDVEGLDGERGLYVVESVKHELDYYGMMGNGTSSGKWITEIRANIIGVNEDG